MRQKSFLVSLALVAVAGMAYGLLSRGAAPGRRLEYATPFLPTAQPTAARTWREPDWRPELSLPAGVEGSPLRLPVAIDVSSDGGIFVLDGLLRQALRYDRKGERWTVLGEEGEQGMGFPTDLAVSRGEGVWVADPRTGRLVLFDRGGQRRRELRPGRPNPARLACLVEEGTCRLAVLYLDGEAPLFQILDATGAPAERFGKVLSGEEQSPLLVDGMVRAGSEGLFYAGVSAGFLAAFDDEGHPRYVVRTVDPVPLPAIQADGTGERVASGSPVASRGLSVSGDRVYLLTRERTGMRRPVIDVYAAGDGRYLRSFRPPGSGRIRDLVVRGRWLYLATDSGITVWRRDGPA